MKCPECKSEDVSRAHRSGRGERLISRLGIFPFRCDSCKARFHRFELERGEHRRRRGHRDLVFYSAGIGLFLAFLYFITRGD